MFYYLLQLVLNFLLLFTPFYYVFVTFYYVLYVLLPFQRKLEKVHEGAQKVRDGWRRLENVGRVAKVGKVGEEVRQSMGKFEEVLGKGRTQYEKVGKCRKM